MLSLRDYQQRQHDELFQQWDAGNRSVMIQLPTGGGKTVIMGAVNQTRTDACLNYAHRSELVGQISMALARNDIPHRVIAATNTMQACVEKHIKECGMSYVAQGNARHGVASVDTLIARSKDPVLGSWLARVGMTSIDEGHHALPNNKWGKALGMTPNAQLVAYTATPRRADRKSLSRSQGGLFDAMVKGPTVRELIDRGYLCDYRIFVPPQSINRGMLKVGTTGDFTQASIKEVLGQSQITGDVVGHYMKLAWGKRGITFAPDVDKAIEIANAFNAMNVPAAAVSGRTNDKVRDQIIDDFKAGKILQLVNVDLFGEGFDVPACEVVSLARPTESLSLFLQQVGRVLRIMEGKPYGIIIDHVSNVARHGLPDTERGWSLEVPDTLKARRRDEEPEIKIKVCANCMGAYEAHELFCPHCGHVPVPEARGSIKAVDGDLMELTPEILAELRGSVINTEYNPIPQNNALNAHKHAQYEVMLDAQRDLRTAMAHWAGIYHGQGEDDRKIAKRFYLTFGVDTMSAQALKSKEARELTDRVAERIWANVG